MKALILAAGIGSRLKPWTDSHPKALVEVGGRPMLARVIENIVAAGISDIIVNVHHFAPQVVDFLREGPFNARITISDESDRLLDTGGALRKVIKLLGGEPVLIHNADILTTLPLRELVYSHVRSGADATLLVDPRHTTRRLVFSDGMLRGWTNLTTGEVKPAGLSISADDSMLSLDGIHIVNPELYTTMPDYAPEGEPFSIIDFYIARCATHAIRGYQIPPEARWWDVGRPETLQAAREFFDNI